ncbi:MAG: hypothetical protein J7639_26820, partial [Paenibacillaceae bacterium]|nr:hypothetical protein [Paenibacillaceae bacterium]
MTLSHERDPILLHAKISPPVARMNLVARQRLVESLEDGARGRLTLLIAPAGFGKTTTLSQWAQQTVNATAWLSLGEADNDPVRFWRYAGQALADALPPETSERALQLVRTARSAWPVTTSTKAC